MEENAVTVTARERERKTTKARKSMQKLAKTTDSVGENSRGVMTVRVVWLRLLLHGGYEQLQGGGGRDHCTTRMPECLSHMPANQPKPTDRTQSPSSAASAVCLLSAAGGGGGGAAPPLSSYQWILIFIFIIIAVVVVRGIRTHI